MSPRRNDSRAHGKWVLLSSRLALESPWLCVRENSYLLPNGHKVPQYFISERADSAICVCRVASEFLLVRQYRPGIEKQTICHPGGRIELNDQNPLTAATRELLEETGYAPNTIQELGAFAQIPAVSNARVHIFLVECKRHGTIAVPEPSEQIEVVRLSQSEIIEAIKAGDMDCIACVAATYLALGRS